MKLMEDSNLSSKKEVLLKDLRIIEEMIVEMADYLVGDKLFWPKIDNKLVQPTVGNFWLRQHRLQALKADLSDTEQQRLDRATQMFDEACSDHSRDFEKKAGQELEARVRQWSESLRELTEDDPPSMAYYRSDVEVRAIVEVMLDHMIIIPTVAEDAMMREIGQLDRQLEKQWIAGNFIWPAEYEPAYPRQKYWWLYGRLK